MSMRILVLGGTGFLGRHVIQEALARGYCTTILDRGACEPTLFASHPEIERLRGDRNTDISALAEHVFDGVVDTSGYNAAQMKRTAAVLRRASSGAHWVYISSISAYASFPSGRDYDESAPSQQGEVGYGANKARAEDALMSSWPLTQQTVVRPALIVGPHDPTGRFTYWPLRVARGGEVLAPGEPSSRMQYIDVRDLAAWVLSLCELRHCGIFNAVAPTVSMEQLLKECRRVTGSTAHFHWCDDRILLDAGVQPWIGLPLWLPGADPDFGGFQRASNARAVGAGLRFRPLSETIRETYEWARAEQDLPRKQVSVINAEHEAKILALLRSASTL
ncbi:NAD-dependent epimerase/dehydratase family protein [Chitinimonas arctica]|uniref:NAD-dependent epimerase/dehydratase family protein n=1 Tax=Chitinimonas arctica TaxID=2594795 RepID=A0A516S9Z7_9NEIS|nr:NAD-dependent epimerase/dehydratase family protein [Chitinimonas arctica]QDQ24957.1 NAD-dependent epimerase/dehydratase family protein [Chitinimonas arctica]